MTMRRFAAWMLVLAVAPATGIAVARAQSRGTAPASPYGRHPEASGHVERSVEMQTMPEAFEWVWKGYKANGR